jgi:hypothetical protein
MRNSRNVTKLYFYMIVTDSFSGRTWKCKGSTNVEGK